MNHTLHHLTSPYLIQIFLFDSEHLPMRSLTISATHRVSKDLRQTRGFTQPLQATDPVVHSKKPRPHLSKSQPTYTNNRFPIFRPEICTHLVSLICYMHSDSHPPWLEMLREEYKSGNFSFWNFRRRSFISFITDEYSHQHLLCKHCQCLTFRGPCIVTYPYNKGQRDALFLNFIW